MAIGKVRRSGVKKPHSAIRKMRTAAGGRMKTRVGGSKRRMRGRGK